MQHYAHSREGAPESAWEPLIDHLRLVADGDADFPGAAGFAGVFGAAEWGRVLGLWHDVGKYSAEFQARLRTANGLNAHLESQPGRVDHSTGGAQHAVRRLSGITGKLLAYCITGHHGGLPDAVDNQGYTRGLTHRLGRTDIPDYSSAPAVVLELAAPGKSAIAYDGAEPSRAAFSLSVFCRMLFSCLVDADYLATEAFVRPETAASRDASQPTPADLLAHLDAHLREVAARAAETRVNLARAAVLAQCRQKAGLPPGFFALTVPTGGGKTLSSLAFALEHAAAHKLRRVIYAIPFTSIIEQNTEVFRKALAGAGPNVVLEHHSNLDPDAETRWARLAAENWDAPLVVTTNVQLFESLFASKPSRCRKLHRIARSVIILDECQTLPVHLLAPTMRMLEELCRNYGCTVVLCSATQPAITAREGFPIGLSGVREIVDDAPHLYESLRRVEVRQLGKLDDGAVSERLCQHNQVLCVVNTRAHAARLFAALREGSDDSRTVFHLSARMCAQHRAVVLRLIRWRLRRDLPCRVISTQLIEAGVDVDFPVVYRAMTGLDSIAQAAGRCNREGRLDRGTVYVFETDVDPRGDLRLRRQLGAEVAGLHDDLLSLEAIEHFFRLTYWSRESEWDRNAVLECFRMSGGPHFQFREAAEKYRLIADAQRPVIVPYGPKGRALVAELRGRSEPPGRGFDRRAQRFVVGVYEWEFQHLREELAIAQYHDRFWVLENESGYDKYLGLRTDVAGFDPARFCV